MAARSALASHVCMFADGVIPAPQGGPFRASRSFPQPKAENIPAEFHPWLGAITDDKTLPQVTNRRAFAKAHVEQFLSGAAAPGRAATTCPASARP